MFIVTAAKIVLAPGFRLKYVYERQIKIIELIRPVIKTEITIELISSLFALVKGMRIIVAVIPQIALALARI